MVSTGYDNAAFVSGVLNLEPRDITPAEWERIIQAALKELTIGYISGLETFGQLLHERNGRNTDYDGKQLAGDGATISTNADFILLGRINPLPVPAEWPKVAAQVNRYEELCEELLALRRSKHGIIHLIQFDVFWSLEVQGDQLVLSRQKLQPTLVVVREDISLTSIFEKLGAEAWILGAKILWRLFSVQGSTAANMRERAKAAQIAEQRLEEYVRRAGVRTTIVRN